jgi:regulator of sigma E protease
LTLESLVVFVLILGVLVYFHELGHFIVAKASKMRVDEFAFGFGPKLLSLFKRNDTEYTIRLVPLGGFVRIAGMEPGEEDVADGFQAQAIWKRALTIFAGPLFSFLLGAAVLLFVGVYWGKPDGTHPEPRVGTVQAHSEAASIDLHAGDWVREIDGVRITRGTQMTQMIHSNPGKKLTLVIERDGKRLTKTAQPRWVVTYLGAQLSFMKPGEAVFDYVEKSSAAAKAGIQADDKLVAINGTVIASGPELIASIKANDGGQPHLVLDRNGQTVRAVVKSALLQWVRFLGARWIFPEGFASEEEGKPIFGGAKANDVLVSINGQKVKTGEDMIKVIDTAKGRPLSLVVNRDNKDEKITVSAADAARVDSGDYIAIGLLGFMPAPRLVKMGLKESLKEGFVTIGGMVESLVRTLTSKRIKQDVGGPVMIARVTQSAVALGPSYVFMLLGSLSLGLAVINLIPLPAVLDGGHLILLAIESVRRKRWTASQMQTMAMVGWAVILLLIVVIFVTDITRIATGQVPQ